jgi:uncharacterized protein YqeY
MALQAQIEQDYKEAFKRSDRGVMSALRLLKAALKNAEIERRAELTEDEVIDVLKREAKKRRESIALYVKGNRPELAAHEEAELAVFQHYLPAGATPEQVKAAVTAAIAELKATGPQDFGRVMKLAMERLERRADGAEVSAAVKEALS